MDWSGIGRRIRAHREFLGYTREEFAEFLDVTPKFCSDIELGVKGMSVPTLCKISKVLRLTTDYILFGKTEAEADMSLSLLLQNCSETERKYAEAIIKTFLIAMNDRGDSPQE